MPAARYFLDELDYLRNSGQEFARYYPKLTNYLSERSTDPDVERLLEGFAFLTGRLREKIDDQLPEVTQSLLMLLWPNFLRPIPSMTILQFDPLEGAIDQRQCIPAGCEVESIPLNGTVCKFRTSYDTDILPLAIGDVHHGVSKEKSVITLRLDSLNGENLRTIGLENLRFFLGGSDYSSLTLGLWLHRYLKTVAVRDLETGAEIPVRRDCVNPVGFGADEAVLPYPDNSFAGYRLLQEFYAFPHKYHFIDIKSVPTAHIATDASGFELVFELERPMPPDVRVGLPSFKLHCVPAINLFDHDAEPFLLDGRRTEHHVRPARRHDGEIEIFSIDRVNGWRPSNAARGTGSGSDGISRSFSRFESFLHEIERVDGREAVYFREKVRQSISGEKLDRLVSFIREDEQLDAENGETISIQLSCFNGSTPGDLAIGDVHVPTHMVPSFVRPSNVTRPTPPRYPVVDGTLQWQLISALSLNYLSLQSVEALRTILTVFDFNAKVDRQRERVAVMRLEGIEKLTSEPVDRLFRGVPVRGMRSVIEMRESKFANEGEMYLFASVLAEFFALYATINSFHELVVRGVEAGEEYRWTARVGNQPLI